MATEVVMPQMGESIAEGTITRWLVKVGDKVERDQPLFEISTDKVDAEIPSPAAGTLLEIRNQEGETVPVNQVVASIGEAGGAQPAAEAAAPAPAAAEAPAPAAEQEVKREETAREAPAPAAAPAPEPALQAAAAPAPAPAEKGDESLEERQRKFSSPLVRNIAAKEGVNLEEISGTGAQGRVTKDDITAYLEQRKTAPAAPSAPVAAAAPAAAPAPPPPAAAAPASRPAGTFHVPAYTANENVEIEPMSKIR
ncbi:MAG TPA: biotin/lipoyl-containing protein, partial [Thermoanaerobaculia bacterium]|nr:biotin/lipoyl-containing protein [Thermoanaerobaculia bacterium]